MGLSRQEDWSELPFPPTGDLPNPGIVPKSPMSPALAGGSFTIKVSLEAQVYRDKYMKALIYKSQFMKGKLSDPKGSSRALKGILLLSF